MQPSVLFCIRPDLGPLAGGISVHWRRRTGVPSLNGFSQPNLMLVLFTVHVKLTWCVRIPTTYQQNTHSSSFSFFYCEGLNHKPHRSFCVNPAGVLGCSWKICSLFSECVIRILKPIKKCDELFLALRYFYFQTFISGEVALEHIFCSSRVIHSSLVATLECITFFYSQHRAASTR